MTDIGGRTIHLENRHTGERLTLRRVKRGDEVWLELKGALPQLKQLAPAAAPDSISSIPLLATP